METDKMRQNRWKQIKIPGVVWSVGSVIILATVYKLVPPTWWAIGEVIPLIQMVDEKVCLYL